MWLKLAKLTDFRTIFGYFHVFQAVKDIRDSFRANTVKKFKFNVWSNFANFCQFFALITDGPGKVSGDLFSICCFLNLHALGYPKSETFFLRALLGQQVTQPDVDEQLL
jgi:hypothetical protein